MIIPPGTKLTNAKSSDWAVKTFEYTLTQGGQNKTATEIKLTANAWVYIDSFNPTARTITLKTKDDSEQTGWNNLALEFKAKVDQKESNISQKDVQIMATKKWRMIETVGNDPLSWAGQMTMTLEAGFSASVDLNGDLTLGQKATAKIDWSNRFGEFPVGLALKTLVDGSYGVGSFPQTENISVDYNIKYSLSLHYELKKNDFKITADAGLAGLYSATSENTAYSDLTIETRWNMTEQMSVFAQADLRNSWPGGTTLPKSKAESELLLKLGITWKFD